MKFDPRLYKIFSVQQPGETHFRTATCAEVECDAFRFGWVTKVPDGAVADQVRAIARQTGRFCTENRVADNQIEFHFPAGQEGFKGSSVHDHKVSLERPAFFRRRQIDGGSVNSIRLSAEDWRDDFGENQNRLADEQQRG